MLHVPRSTARRPYATGVAVALALTGLLLSGCGMTDDKTDDAGSGIPDAGTASTDDAVAAVKDVSSQIFDFTGVPGKASEPGPGVKECEGKDPKKYFVVYHPWNFAPKNADDTDLAVANLKKKLNTGGWVLKDSYHDNSPNKNLNLVADNDSKKMSVWIVAYAERDTPSLGIEVTSGCYRAPEGQTVEHF
ncbi:hypothetical protein [Streptomyces odontomachi]|uniref:hypothetical protein n=1 Tax=Streptomyces odontomachi TaxID=2944940 RepID=UPI00210941FF|nr:hypothetical protein [Streptomyces sp. ODS25]